MRIRCVTAHAFGPFTGARLDLADGLTVVYGPNESGKSTWHAALYLALCGRRRGRGKAGPDHQRLAERHRPWDRDEWLVSAEVVLDDGRRVEFRQDLDGRVDCHAKDLVLGTDLTAEFLHDGTPDAARWLGLDRHSFAATALVSQAQVMSVLDRADALAEHLQRAAATAGTDSTAAAALARLDAFQAERVGTEKAPTRPLRRAVDEAGRAREALDEARTAHALYQGRVAEVERLREARRAAEHRLRGLEAAAAARTARDLRARADEAAALHGRLGGVEPVADAAADALARDVVEALSGWAARPEAPDVPDPADPAGPSDEELWELARVLDEPVPVAEPAPRTKPWPGRVAVAAAVGALGGAALVARGDRLLGGLVLALAVGLALAGLWSRSRRAEGGAVAAAHRHAAAQRRTAAVTRCAQLGLPPEPGALRARARERAGGVIVATRDRQWRHQWERTRDRAAARVLAVAARCGVRARTAEEAVAGLRAWTAAHDARLSQLDEARRDWARLLALLDGRTLADLTRAADAAAVRGGADGLSEVDADLTGARATAAAAVERAVEAEGSLRERAATLPPVAEAEERRTRADAELTRLRDLAETLELARRFLADAQERAHRDIAPVLADSVRRSLPAVTAGRYTDVIVDPATLRVQVCGPGRRWRDAARLSHGTAEQIYLLLRMALAGTLVRDSRVCPLVLDDVTVHADADRTLAVLDLLRRAAEDRQVILFTQQEAVRDWARAELRSPRHALVELSAVAAV